MPFGEAADAAARLHEADRRRATAVVVVVARALDIPAIGRLAQQPRPAPRVVLACQLANDASAVHAHLAIVDAVPMVSALGQEALPELARPDACATPIVGARIRLHAPSGVTGLGAAAVLVLLAGSLATQASTHAGVAVVVVVALQRGRQEQLGLQGVSTFDDDKPATLRELEVLERNDVLLKRGEGAVLGEGAVSAIPLTKLQRHPLAGAPHLDRHGGRHRQVEPRHPIDGVQGGLLAGTAYVQPIHGQGGRKLQRYARRQLEPGRACRAVLRVAIVVRAPVRSLDGERERNGDRVVAAGVG